MTSAPPSPKIGLGTAQIGMCYGGQENIRPCMTEADSQALLEFAWKMGVQIFDTAPAYGLSEERIGLFLKQNDSANLEVITKISGVEDEVWSNADRYREFAQASVTSSLRTLGAQKLELVLLHQCSIEFLNSPSVEKAIELVLSSGLVNRFGVSVYTPDQAIVASSKSWVSAIQAPVNILDHRFVSTELVETLHSKNIRLIARSLFLRGLLNSPDSVAHFARFSSLQTLYEKASEVVPNSSLESLSVQFIFGNLSNLIDTVLIGVDDIPQLKSNLELIQHSSHPLSTDVVEQFRDIGLEAAQNGLLNPSNWNTTGDDQ